MILSTCPNKSQEAFQESVLLFSLTDKLHISISFILAKGWRAPLHHYLRTYQGIKLDLAAWRNKSPPRL